MDVPTLAKLSQFRAGGRTPWQLIDTLVSFGVLLIQLLSQVLVLLHLLREQSDSVWLVIGSFADPLVRYLKDNHTPCKQKIPSAIVCYSLMKSPSSLRSST